MNEIRDGQSTNVHIEVQNFGPIERAEIDLRPLTVFVGESNTGKTYLAALIYALYGSFAGFSRFPWSHHDVLDLRLTMRELQTPKNAEITEALEKLNANGLPFKFSDLPLDMRNGLQSNLKDSEVFGKQLKRCFSLESVSELIRFTGVSCNEMNISLRVGEETQPLWSVDMQVSESGTTIDGSVNANMIIYSVDERIFPGPLGVRELETLLRPDSRETAQVYYLPATRRSIMQNYAGVSKSFIKGTLSVASESNVEIPSLSTMEKDFLKRISGYKEHKGSAEEVIRISKELEVEVLRGEIEVKRAESGRTSEFLYRPQQEKQALSLSHSSSMVSELAPLVLFLRGIVQPGDLLIIEEPEAHLHPGAQTKIAHILARLIRVGVRVVITTHSEWLLQEIGNLIREGELKKLAKNRTESESWMAKEEVGTWWFHRDKPVTEIPFDRIEGVEPQDYYEVADKLYNRFVRLEQQFLDEEAAGAIE